MLAFSSGASSPGKIVLLIHALRSKEWLDVKYWMKFKSFGICVCGIVKLCFGMWDLAGLGRHRDWVRGLG
jgi:hypothetical protein